MKIAFLKFSRLRYPTARRLIDMILLLIARAVAAANGLHLKSPLWYYILKEAEVAGGNHLGSVGSRLVM